MMGKSVHSQAAATDVATAHFRAGLPPPKLREPEREMIEAGLKAATRTLWTINSWRSKLPPEFIAECEGT